MGSSTCTANAGDVCEDSTYGLTKACCSPYTCSTLTSRTKTCQGLSLSANETCFAGGASVGTCATGLICLDGKCKEIGTCADPVFPGSLCYSGDVNRYVATCCSGSHCGQPPSKTDGFCMRFDLAEGAQCGDTEAREFRGYCNTGLNCINGVCSTSTTTSTTTTATTVACKTSGATCWTGSGPIDTCCTGICNLGTKKC